MQNFTKLLYQQWMDGKMDEVMDGDMDRVMKDGWRDNGQMDGGKKEWMHGWREG